MTVAICSFVYYFLTKGLTKRVKIKLKNPKITKKLRKKCLRVVVGYHHGYRVCSVKYFQEAFCRMVKTLIAIDFQETRPLKLLPRIRDHKMSSETRDPGLFILFHYRKEQLFCHIPINILGLIHCVEHKATIKRPLMDKASFLSY